MSTTYHRRRTAGIPPDKIRAFAADATAAADHALAGTRALVDKSPARQAAREFSTTVNGAIDLYEEVLDRYEKAERDDHTRPEVIRQQWQEYAQDVHDRAAKAHRILNIDYKESIEEMLLGEALPVSTDPSAALLARQEIDLALQIGEKNNRSASLVLDDLAARGGEVSAALVSNWGRLRYESATGYADGHDAIRRRAVETVLATGDETRTRAARVLQAATEPRPGSTGTSLYEAMFLAQRVVIAAEELAQRGPTPR